MNGQSALNAYASTQAHSSVFDASPHKLISLLFEGAQTRLISVKVAMEAGNIAKRGELIGKVIDIVSTLQANLDTEKGAEVAQNLDSLYEYMTRRLLEANRTNDQTIIDEVHGLIGEIKAGWDGIAEQAAG